MAARRARALAAALAAALTGVGAASALGDLAHLELAGARLVRLRFADLPAWPADRHADALSAFKATCARPSGGASPATGLDRACAEAGRVEVGDEAARRFFEREFDPVEVTPAGAERGFLTGYYEPELAGSIEADDSFRVPLLARPDDLVSAEPGERPAGWPDGLAAARRTAAGFEPYPDRAAIADGALGDRARAVAYLADPVDAFMVQVQGSARLRLRDGRVIRVGYAGRNGHPYTSIGRVLAEQEGVPPAVMTADRLVAWLKAHPERAPAIMRRNRSFVFFRTMEALGADDGPIGAAGVSLTPGRSLAVDAKVWPYGGPVWIEADLPAGAVAVEPVRRLVIAQDTGTAIVGPARGDLFFGSGEEAGARASLVRHPVRWIALVPKAPPVSARPRRPLSAEERRLWAAIARSVRPLGGRTAVAPAAPEPAAAPPPPPPPAPARPHAAARPAAPKPAPPALPPLAPMERRTTRALARGQRSAAAVLDLHGLTQAEAHPRLIGFLHRAQAAGHGLVLVVTGRGASGPAGGFGEDRGVLRRTVPHWLRLPELRALVLGFEEAGPRQGGAGALYVRLRRARPGG